MLVFLCFGGCGADSTYAESYVLDHPRVFVNARTDDLVIAPENVTIKVGEECTLYAVPSDFMIEWVSSDESIATVSSDGLVRGIAPGNAVITAKSTNGSVAYSTISVVGPSVEMLKLEATQDGRGIIQLSWTDMGSNAFYQVYEGAGNTLKLLKLLHGTTSTSIVAASDGSHTYTVLWGTQNADGGVSFSASSAPVTIDVAMIWSADISNVLIRQTDVSDVQLSWQGIVPTDAYEIAEVSNGDYMICQTNVLPDENTFSLHNVTAGVHQYVVRASYTDEDGKVWKSPWSSSTSINVLREEEYTPAVPRLVFENDNLAFSATEEGAPVYQKGAITVNWEPSEYADAYSVSLAKMSASGYSTLIEEHDIKSTNYMFSESLFDKVESREVYRFGISAQGAGSSDTSYSFFTVEPTDLRVLINGNETARWEHASRQAGSREFTISSSLPWTATSDVSWITTRQNEDVLEVSITMYAATYQSYSREGQVTVSNGQNTAVIDVFQGGLREGECNEPAICKRVLSTDPMNPTLVSAGGFLLEVDLDTPYALLQFAEGSNGSYSTKYSTVISSPKAFEIPYEWGGMTFSSGKNFRIAVTGHFSNDRNNYSQYGTDEDACLTYYYFRMDDTNHYLFVEGKQSLSVNNTDNNIEGRRLSVVSSNLCTVTSDQDWLTYTFKPSVNPSTNTVESGLYIRTERNNTGNTRVGHLTLSTLYDTAVIEVTQIDMTPRITYPTNISTNENSPTLISSDLYPFTFFGMYITLAYKEGSTWVEEEQEFCSSTKEEEQSCYFAEEDLVLNKTCRITVHSSESLESTVYYVKRTSSTTNYTVFYVDDYGTIKDSVKDIVISSAEFSGSIILSASSSWKVSSNASWLTLSATSGASGTKRVLDLYATKNTGTSDRTGVITFKIGTTVTGILTVKQMAACNEQLEVLINDVPIEFDTTASHVRGRANTISGVRPNVFSGARVNVSSNVDWITVSTSLIISGKAVSIDLTENTTSVARTGKVTFTFGSASKVLTITQMPALSAVSVISPSMSNSSASPTSLDYTGNSFTIKWNRVQNAAKYVLYITRTADNGLVESYFDEIEDTGVSVFTYEVPAEYFNAAFDGVYSLKIYAKDAWENLGENQYYYFTYSAGDKVFLNGKASQSLINVSDAGAIKEYQVATSGSWTATASASWIHTSMTSGTGNQTITVTIDRNNSSKRSGTLTIQSGSATATLTIDQCAVLSEYPSLSTPILSSDRLQPTFVAQSDSMTVTWQPEPQANYYIVQLLRVVSSGRSSIIQKSENLRKGETSYTFDTSELIPGQLYRINISRNAEFEIGRSHSTGASYYFTMMPENAYLKLEGINVITNTDADLDFYADGLEDSRGYYVKASGTWTAVSSDSSWLMVAKAPKYTSEFREYEEPSDYDMTVGNDGENFYISVTENDTHNTRKGYVTVATAGVSYRIEVIQDQYYVKPELMSPDLGTRSSDAVELPLEPIVLNWTSGEGNTGVYDIVLSEKDGRSYYKVFSLTNVSGNTATIPSVKLNENKSYRIQIICKLENSGEVITSSYYFTTGSANALAVSVDADWSQVNYGGCLDFTVNASGGAGGYLYAFELLCDGQQESITQYDKLMNYQFWPKGQGTYTLKVYVKDSAGKTATCTSSFLKDDTNVISVAVDNSYSVDLNANRHSLNYMVISSGDWVLESCPDWITSSSTTGISGDALILVVSRNDSFERSGKVQLRSSKGNRSELTVTQSGSKSIVLSSMNGEYGATAQSVTLTVSANSNWTVSTDSNWVKLSTASGKAGITDYSFNIDDNFGESRTANVIFSCNGAHESFTLQQNAPIAVKNGLVFYTSATQVQTGETVSFVITAPEKMIIRIVVNDTGYEWYQINEGTNTIQRAFTSSGVKNVQFQPWTNYGWGAACEAQVVTVNAQYTLAKPIIHDIGTQVIASDFTLSWDDVPNATSYTVYVYNADREQIWPHYLEPYASTTKLNSILIPGNVLFAAGKYAVNVVATAAKANAATGAADFTVCETNEAVAITVPVNNAIYNITDVMHTRVVTAGEKKYTKLLVTDPDGEPKEYLPESDGLFVPVATKKGIYQMQPFASDVEDFSIGQANVYSGAIISVNVNPPAVRSVTDPWNNQYGAVFTQNDLSVNAIVNCLGEVTVYLDDVDMGRISPVDNDRYHYQYAVSRLSEGKHSVAFEVAYGSLVSARKSMPVYSIKELPKAEQVLKYAVTTLTLLSNPDASTGRTINKGDKVTLLGTYGTELAYIKHGNYYGFVHKAMLVSYSDFLDLSQDESSPEGPVATPNPTEQVTEEEFRDWAADTLVSYYFEYCEHDNASNQFPVEFTNFDVLRDIVFKHTTDIVDISTSLKGSLDGIYKEYYLMSMYKLHYDFNGYKDDYYFVQTDDESDADYETRMMPFYKQMLIETLQQKAEIDPESFVCLERNTRGAYALKFDEATGKMKMVVDENGLMSNLDRMGDVAVQEAWTDFAIKSISLAVDVAEAYFDIQSNPFAQKNKYRDNVKEAIKKGVEQFASTLSNTYFTNEMNNLENNLYEIIVAEIASTRLQDYNRIIAYYENIYAGEDDTFVEYRSDELFKKAVRELIELTKSVRFSESEAYARKMLTEYYRNGVTLKHVMSKEEIGKALACEFTTQIIHIMVSPIKTYAEECIKEGMVVIPVVLEMTCDAISAGLKELTKQYLDSLANGSGGAIENTDAAKREICFAAMKGCVDCLEQLETGQNGGFTGAEVKLKLWYEMNKVIISHLNDVYEIAAEFNGTNDSQAWEKLQDTLVQLLEDIFDGLIKSGKDYLWSNIAHSSIGAEKASELTDWVIIASALNIKDGILGTADALAKAMGATTDALENVKQISYCANAMLVAYRNSLPLELEVMCRLEDYMIRKQRMISPYSLRAAIHDSSIVSIEDLLYVTDCIMLQAEYDYIGTEWLLMLLQQGDSALKQSKFMSNLKKQLPEYWFNRMTEATAIRAHNCVFIYRSIWLNGWKDAYRTLAD